MPFSLITSRSPAAPSGAPAAVHCNETILPFSTELPVHVRYRARIISSVMIPGRSCHSAQNCQYMSAVMRRSCQNCQYMSTVMRRSCHSVQNCQYMSAIMIPGHRRADNQQITSSAHHLQQRHQAHEERHLQRCDDKQQPNDQEHQQRSTSSSMIRSTRANYKQQLEGE